MCCWTNKCIIVGMVKLVVKSHLFRESPVSVIWINQYLFLHWENLQDRGFLAVTWYSCEIRGIIHIRLVKYFPKTWFMLYLASSYCVIVIHQGYVCFHSQFIVNYPMKRDFIPLIFSVQIKSEKLFLLLQVWVIFFNFTNWKCKMQIVFVCPVVLCLGTKIMWFLATQG